MQKSDQINELASALAKAQGSMSGAIKDSQNPFFKSSYANLESVWDACRKPLASNGLSVSQLISGNELETILMHSSGQWISSSTTMNPVKNDPQGIGSCVSYFRRYALAAIVGVYQMDDDAVAAQGQNKPQNPQRSYGPPEQKTTTRSAPQGNFGPSYNGK